MPELVGEERAAALEAENARMMAALERIHEGASRTAQDSRSRDDDRYCIADVIETSARALSGGDSALKARLDAARKQGRLDAECEPIVDSEGTAWSDLAAFTHGQACKVSSLRAQLAERDAQMERLRAVADDVVQGGGIADLEDARAALSETPEQSLAAVREQARREALESLPHYPGCGRLPCSLCVALAAQPAMEPQP